MSATTLLLASTFAAMIGQHDDAVFHAKNIEVKKQFHYQLSRGNRDADVFHHTLIFHGINIGTNFLKPARDARAPDLSRLATTYYHRNSPAGIVMDRFNWFPGPTNTFWADCRLPASLVGLSATIPGPYAFPAGPLLGLWSEPPVAVLGMEVGTMASYARPLQHFHFFERNPDILKLSLPAQGKTRYFQYLHDAESRGAQIRVYPGELRPTLAKAGAGGGFYHVMVVNIYKDGIETVHTDLLTKEGISLCMSKLAPDGILCIHTSSRFYHMMPIIADAAKDLGLAWYHGTDQAPWRDEEDMSRTGHFSSEWAMLARSEKSLKGLTTPPGYDEAVKRKPGWKGYSEKFWHIPKAAGKYLWTDEGSHSFTGLYRSDPGVRTLDKILYRLEDFMGKAVDRQIVGKLARPLHSAIDALDDYVVSKKNAPPKE